MYDEWGEWKCQKVNLHEHTQCTETNSDRSRGCLEGAAALIQSETSSWMSFQDHNVVHCKNEKREGVYLNCDLK